LRPALLEHACIGMLALHMGGVRSVAHSKVVRTGKPNVISVDF